MSLRYPIATASWDALKYPARPADASGMGVRVEGEPYVRTLADRLGIVNGSAVNVRTYGAVGDGATDDTAAIQAAITAAANGVLLIPAGTFVITSPLTLSAEIIVQLDGELVAGPGWAGSQMISITSSDVYITGHGVIDGNSQTMDLAINAVGTDRLVYVELDGITIKTVNPTYALNDAKGAVGFQFVDYPTMTNVKFRNCGGGVVYWSNCANGKITGCNVDSPLFLGIQLGACFNCVVSDCTVTDAGYFCYKSGFGTSLYAPTADEAPTLTTFTVAADANSRRQFVSGMHLYVLETAPNTVYDSEVTLVEDLGTYLRITVSGFQGVPTVGRQLLVASKNNRFDSNTADGSGENAFDHNIEVGLSLRDNNVRRGGIFTDVVTPAYVGVCGGLWIGADPIFGFNGVYCKELNVSGNNVANCKGPGICIWSCVGSVAVGANTVTDIDKGNETGTPVVPTYSAISVNNLTYVRCDDVTITGNNVDTDEGNGIHLGFSLGAVVSGNRIKAPAGLRFTDMVGRLNVSGNSALANRSGSATLAVVFSTTSINGVTIAGNCLENDQGVGDVLLINDTGAAGVNVTRDNRLSSGGAALINVNCDYISGEDDWLSTTKCKVPVISSAREDKVGFAVANLASVTLAEFEADNGTAGGVIIDLVGWNTGGREIAQLAIVADVGANNVALTSLASTVAVFAVGDFAVANVGGVTMRVTYTNNSGSTVRFGARILNVSRY